MDIYTVSFFGHRRIGSESVALEGRLEAEIRCLLDSKPYVEFLVGRNGDFDLLVSPSVEKNIPKRQQLPYMGYALSYCGLSE